MVTPVDQFKGMRAQWSYWAIDRLKDGIDSWANWTVINKIGQDSWIWQIPLYNSSILSMGLLHRGELLSNDDFIKHVEKHSAACYQLSSIAKNPEKAIKPYMKEVHSRLHYSRRSRECTGKNWILVGDAYCFADPVYSTGSGVAMLEAITIANILNKNGGKFDHQWYEKNCNALLKTVIDGIDTWYSGAAFNKKVNQRINRTILQGGFSRYFQPSAITEHAKRVQLDSVETFLSSVPSVDQFSKAYLKTDIKVYYFDKSSFVKTKNVLTVVNQGQSVSITNKAVSKVFEEQIIGKKLSYPDLYLIVELSLKTLNDKAYFWKIIRFIELIGLKNPSVERLYYFHPERYETLKGQLKLGSKGQHLFIKDSTTIEFFEKLKGKIFFGKEIVKLASKTSNPSPRMQEDLRSFFKTFCTLDTFGQNFCLIKK